MPRRLNIRKFFFSISLAPSAGNTGDSRRSPNTIATTIDIGADDTTILPRLIFARAPLQSAASQCTYAYRRPDGFRPLLFAAKCRKCRKSRKNARASPTQGRVPPAATARAVTDEFHADFAAARRRHDAGETAAMTSKRNTRYSNTMAACTERNGADASHMARLPTEERYTDGK